MPSCLPFSLTLNVSTLCSLKAFWASSSRASGLMVNGALNFSVLSFFARNLLPSFSSPRRRPPSVKTPTFLPLPSTTITAPKPCLVISTRASLTVALSFTVGLVRESTSFTFMVMRRVST